MQEIEATENPPRNITQSRELSSSRFALGVASLIGILSIQGWISFCGRSAQVLITQQVLAGTGEQLSLLTDAETVCLWRDSIVTLTRGSQSWIRFERYAQKFRSRLRAGGGANRD